MAEVTIRELPPCARISLRAGPAAAAGIGEAVGVALGNAPCRASVAGTLAALWLGPDEWLLIAKDGQTAELMRAASEAASAEPASIVDVSHRTIAVEILGPAAADALNAFCALDLHPGAFPVGMCTRTLFGKAEIVLWRTAPATFRLEVARSFVPYVHGCLGEAVRECMS